MSHSWMRFQQTVIVVLCAALIGFALWVVTDTAPKDFRVSHLAAFALTCVAFVVTAGLMALVLILFRNALRDRIRIQEHQAQQPRAQRYPEANA
jgi:predicted PurR-regulated permease PerM